MKIKLRYFFYLITMFSFFVTALLIGKWVKRNMLYIQPLKF